MEKEYLDKIDEIIELMSESEDLKAAEIYERAKQIRYVLRNTEPKLVSSKKLTAFTKGIRNAYAYKHTLTNLGSYLDQALDALPMPVNRKRTKSETLDEIKRIKLEADEKIKEINVEKAALIENLNESKTKQQNLQDKLSQIELRINTESTRLDTLVSDQQKDFTKKRDQLTQSTQKDLSEVESTANELLKKIQNLYNISSENSVRGYYQTVAKTERVSADRWRGFAFSAFILVPIVPMVLYFLDETKSLDLSILARKIAIGITFLIPAFYFARESTKHRALQFDAQKTGVRVSSFEPFISTLNETDSQELRKKMVEEWFTDKGDTGGGRGPLMGFSKRDLVKLVTEVVASMKK